MITIIIPAFNESSVITRTLKAITVGSTPGELDVIVVCNGCTDDTADVARKFGQPVRVVETKLGNKANALNLGDRAAVSFPRVYADADVLISIDTIRSLVKRLDQGDVLAVAPTPDIDVMNCSWSVRAFYDIRSRLPSSREGIGGSGVYALSETEHSRFSEFPAVTADDGFVRLQFKPNERETLASVHSTVFAPRTVKDLIAIKTRSHYGSFELAKLYPQLWDNKGESNNSAVARLIKYPWLWHELATYCWVTITAKRRAKDRLRAGAFAWQRDETSRVAAERVVSEQSPVRR
jgi:glycosyltransferase involved in cell wall biosynthesis